MRLYYSPGACSLSPHIVAREADLDVELSKVSFSAEGRTTEQGEDFFKVNPKGGYVPALRLDDDEVLTEGVAIVQYLADQVPTKSLVPKQGTLEHYRLLELLTFINSELHKGFSGFFRSGLADDEMAFLKDRLLKRFAYVNEALEGKEYLLGTFSIADAYAYTILRWTKRFEISLAEFPNIVAFMKRMEGRPAVQKALAEEGLEPVGA
ncbi:MAG: glutathione transferase GstA [Candidatus Pacebacteria bacterium]|nr:glutathione transferase GstA [Candidatus Paceibacterota bacterium]